MVDNQTLVSEEGTGIYRQSDLDPFGVTERNAGGNNERYYGRWDRQTDVVGAKVVRPVELADIYGHAQQLAGQVPKAGEPAQRRVREFKNKVHRPGQGQASELHNIREQQEPLQGQLLQVHEGKDGFVVQA